MTSSESVEATPWVPRDTFGIRLAIVRAEMRWNYDKAERATGINSESWRLWERGDRRCRDMETVANTISVRTGVSYQWLMIGGPLMSGRPVGPVGPAGLEPATYGLEVLGLTDDLAARRALRQPVVPRRRLAAVPLRLTA